MRSGVTHVQGARAWMGLATMAIALSGCSAILDTDKVQCKVDTDCGQVDGKATYSCVQNFCKPVSCTTDAECQARGPFICDEGSCEPPQCSTNEQCDPGQECHEARCGAPKDPIFGCFNENPPGNGEPPLLTIPAYQFFGDNVPIFNLGVKVCDALDTVCTFPVTDMYQSYEDNLLTIGQVSNGQRYTIRITGTDQAGEALLPTDYIMARPVRGATREINSVQLVPAGVPDIFAAGAQVTYDPKKAILVMQVFGCDDAPLAGVSAMDSRGGSTLFYLTDTGADPNLTETDSSGQVGFINMDAAEDGTPFTHKIIFRYKGQPMYSFAVQPRPGVLNFSLMYMADYGVTTERAATPPTRQ